MTAFRFAQRAETKLAEVLAEFAWVDEDGTALVRDVKGALRWWTFAGLRANRTLAELLQPYVREGTREENLSVRLLDHADVAAFEAALRDVDRARVGLDSVPIPAEALDGLKFSACLPAPLATRLLRERLEDVQGTLACLNEPIAGVVLGD